jgi:hypothetical protein
MRQAQQGTSQDTNRQCGGRFTIKSTLPFDPTEKNNALDAAQVYTLLELTGIDMNGRIPHMVDKVLKAGKEGIRASTPTHDTVPPRMIGAGMV